MEALCFQVIHLSVCDLAVFIAGCSFVCFADTAALALYEDKCCTSGLGCSLSRALFGYQLLDYMPDFVITPKLRLLNMSDFSLVDYRILAMLQECVCQYSYMRYVDKLIAVFLLTVYITIITMQLQPSQSLLLLY